jgi:hypothetical protein
MHAHAKNTVVACNGFNLPVSLLPSARKFPTLALLEIWLTEPCPALGYRIPRFLLDQPGGLNLVAAAQIGLSIP